MSVSVMNFIVNKYGIAIDPDVVAAAGNFIQGRPHPGHPVWLSRIVANQVDDVDLDKLDYLARDVNRTLSISRFEFMRLIRNCRVVEGQLAWKLSEVHTIERLFFVRNDMYLRVYTHRVVQALNFMVVDMLVAADGLLRLSAALDDVEQYVKLDDRLMLLIEGGDAGHAARAIAERILQRKLYRRVGEVRQNQLQASCEQMEMEIAEAAGLDASKIRVGKTLYRFGVRKTEHPLFQIAFWRHGTDAVVKLSEDDLTLFVPMDFFEMAINVFVTDGECFAKARAGFERWRTEVARPSKVAPIEHDVP
jgi:HD superfamily phosphohydrolase